MVDHLEKNNEITDSEVISQILKVIQQKNKKRLLEIIESLHISDAAFYFSYLSFDQKRVFLDLLINKLNPVFFTKINPSVLEDTVKIIGVRKIAKIISSLDSYDATDIISDLDSELQEGIISQIPTKLKDDVTSGLKYSDDSIGRIMHKDVITVPTHWNIQQIKKYINKKADHLHEYVSGVIVVDHLHKPQGTIPLNIIFKHTDDTKLEDIMISQNISLHCEDDLDDLATNFRKYTSSIVAVIDDHDRVQGAVYLSDVVEVIAETAEEDILHLAGVQESDIFSNFYKTLTQRMPWLFINLLTAISASIVIAFFDATIEKIVTLAVLMPIVASMGGNAGTQTITIAIRALATNELNSSNSKKIIFKEIVLGMVNGTIFGLLSMAVIMLIYHDFSLALLFSIATFITLTIAGLSGVMIPLIINHFKADPAISSGILLTTITDVIAFLTFLGFATIFIL